MSDEFYRVHALRKRIKEALEREEQLKIDLEDRSVLADMYIKACTDMTVENVKLKEQIEHQRDLKCKALVLCGEAINQNVSLKKELIENQQKVANCIKEEFDMTTVYYWDADDSTFVDGYGCMHHLDSPGSLPMVEKQEYDRVCNNLESEVIAHSMEVSANMNHINELEDSLKNAEELLAKAIYQQWYMDKNYVRWVEGGNSLKQDEARAMARSQLKHTVKQPQQNIKMPTPEQAMHWVMHYQDSVKTNCTGTTNWAANIGMYIANKIKGLNEDKVK